MILENNEEIHFVINNIVTALFVEAVIIEIGFFIRNTDGIPTNPNICDIIVMQSNAANEKNMMLFQSVAMHTVCNEKISEMIQQNNIYRDFDIERDWYWTYMM